MTSDCDSGRRHYCLSVYDCLAKLHDPISADITDAIDLASLTFEMFSQAHVVALNKLRLCMLLFVFRAFALYRLSLADILAQSPPSQFTALRSHSLANMVDRTN